MLADSRHFEEGFARRKIAGEHIGRLPRHVAIIMMATGVGGRAWAARIAGHRAGVEAVPRRLNGARLGLGAFRSMPLYENWKRSAS